MNPDTISALVNLGSAGAVIIVIVIFLDYQKKQAAEWRDFFTTLNTANQSDITDMRQVSDRITKALDALLLNYATHDLQAKEIKGLVNDIRTALARLIPNK